MVLVKTMVFIHFYVRKKPKLNLLLEKDFENGIDCILFLVKTNFKGGGGGEGWSFGSFLYFWKHNFGSLFTQTSYFLVI